MNKELLSYLKKPEIDTKSTAKFWDDEHISKGMLKAHLDPQLEAATRTFEFVDRSVEWITSIVPSSIYPRLLDLGCGPGLYASRFDKKGFTVTGVDFSKRSIDYAVNAATAANQSITYHYQDYLTISYEEKFDVITLIYCDFSVLSEADRTSLLANIYRALKPGGKFIVDVATPKQYENRKESTFWTYQESDFWCDKPHLLLDAFYRYDEDNIYLHQAVIATEASIHSYYIWDHAFTKEKLERELHEGGFGQLDFFADVAGALYHPDSVSICAVAVK